VSPSLHTAGECLAFDCALDWVTDLIAEGSVGELRVADMPADALLIRVESTRMPFETRGLTRLSRGAWHREGEVVLENACTSGFDLRVSSSQDGWEFSYRWRPPARERAAGLILRSRFHLLARAVLMQYPALWCAGLRGRAPLHASGWTHGDSSVVVTASSGIGRSTLLLHELDAGARATGDNLAVSDGSTLWGLVEPMRVDGGSGRRMAHGRREVSPAGRIEAVAPDAVVVLERGPTNEPMLRRCRPEVAERGLVTNTYEAGELRRYWPYAATLAAGTGSGPAHPPVSEVASDFVAARPCFSLSLGTSPGAPLRRLLAAVEVAECV
jgi:hypothetical protein